jgi:phosphomannomutase
VTGSKEPTRFDDLDGLTVSTTDWSFNVRPSNTEPLLRLNVEARSESEMLRLQELVLRLMTNR